MDYYKEIKEQIINNEITKRVKDYSKNRSDLNTYYNIGKLLYEAGKHYGEGIIKKYSIRLTAELGKKYTVSLLYKTVQFYNIFQKVPTVSGNLTWSHWYEVLSIKDINKIKYYIEISEEQSLSVRELRDRIKRKEYERLPKSTKEKIREKRKPYLPDLIKNPIVIRNPNNTEVEKEKVLQKLILEEIESFMKELGSFFCFIGSEYKIKIGNSYNYVDLLLYNIKYRCYVVVELKTTSLKKEHIGQIMLYMNYINEKLKSIVDNKTVGIIVCRKNNKYVIKYCSLKQIISREYEII